MQSPENTNPNVLRDQLQGIGSGSSGMNLDSTVLLINEDSDGWVADKTYNETLELFQAGITIWVLIPDGSGDSGLRMGLQMNKYSTNITRESDSAVLDVLGIEGIPFSYWSDGQVDLSI